MEDFATFVEVLSPFLFFRLQWGPGYKTVKEMFERQWSALRRAVMCIIRPRGSLDTVVREYRTEIKKYADEASKVMLP